MIFLPSVGVGEIRRVSYLLEQARRPQAVVLPLYGDLPAEEQDRAIRCEPGLPSTEVLQQAHRLRTGAACCRPSPDGERRVVLATPIAESSLTISGVRVVVDSGRCRSPRFDPVTGMDKLYLQEVSQASADQRAGRAGIGRAGSAQVRRSPALRSWASSRWRITVTLCSQAGRRRGSATGCGLQQRTIASQSFPVPR